MRRFLLCAVGLIAIFLTASLSISTQTKIEPAWLTQTYQHYVMPNLEQITEFVIPVAPIELLAMLVMSSSLMLTAVSYRKKIIPDSSSLKNLMRFWRHSSHTTRCCTQLT
jgi:hypothetical protein